MRRKPILLTVPLLLGFALAMPVKAAAFTPQELAEVRRFQNEYAALDKTAYSAQNLYAVKPSLKKSFKAGSLSQRYVAAQLAYINYYRDLFGLKAVKTTSADNKKAQTTAAVMAAINANPFVNQHGLPTDKRPSFISKKTWLLAQDVSSAANLNFNASNQSAGDVITDLVTDRYNLSGSDTGHRAWILSTRLSKVSIGAAYGTNGYRYSVNQVLNLGDAYAAPSREMVAYPNAGVFPIELLNGKNIAWSLYFSTKFCSKTPTITVTDDDTHKTYKATNVANYSSYGFGNFQTVLTYYPAKLKLQDGHQYTVRAGKLATYTFKLFKQSDATRSYATSGTVASSSTNKSKKVSQKVLNDKGLAKYLYKVGKNISTIKSSKITTTKSVAKKTKKTAAKATKKQASKKTSKKKKAQAKKKTSKKKTTKKKAKSSKAKKQTAKKTSKKTKK